jgi:hypothetical protein
MVMILASREEPAWDEGNVHRLRLRHSLEEMMAIVDGLHDAKNHGGIMYDEFAPWRTVRRGRPSFMTCYLAGYRAVAILTIWSLCNRIGRSSALDERLRAEAFFEAWKESEGEAFDFHDPTSGEDKRIDPDNVIGLWPIRRAVLDLLLDFWELTPESEEVKPLAFDIDKALEWNYGLKNDFCKGRWMKNPRIFCQSSEMEEGR